MNNYLYIGFGALVLVAALTFGMGVTKSVNDFSCELVEKADQIGIGSAMLDKLVSGLGKRAETLPTLEQLQISPVGSLPSTRWGQYLGADWKVNQCRG